MSFISTTHLRISYRRSLPKSPASGALGSGSRSLLSTALGHCASILCSISLSFCSNFHTGAGWKTQGVSYGGLFDFSPSCSTLPIYCTLSYLIGQNGITCEEAIHAASSSFQNIDSLKATLWAQTYTATRMEHNRGVYPGLTTLELYLGLNCRSNHTWDSNPSDQ